MAQAKKSVYDVVVLGSCNTDFIFYADQIPQSGIAVQGSKCVTQFGGKGGNQALAAAKLGASVALIGRVGDDDLGKEYTEYLKDRNVDTTYLKKSRKSETGSAQITVTPDGNSHIIIFPGANDLVTAKDVMSAKNIIENAKVFLMQFEIPLEAGIQGLKLCNGFSIVNGSPAREDNSSEVMKLSNLFSINKREAEAYTGSTLHDISEAREAAKKMLKMGCNSVIITMGKLGAVYAADENAVKVFPAPKVPKIVDATGAHDAFLGGVAYTLSRETKHPIDKAIEVGTVVAGISIQKTGIHDSFPDSSILQNLDL